MKKTLILLVFSFIAVGVLVKAQIQGSNETVGATQALPPVGTIVAFLGQEDQIPDGWLLCNGDKLEKANYMALYSILKNLPENRDETPDSKTFTLPKLSGYFLKGIESSDQLGKKQDWATGKPKISALDTITNEGGGHAHELQDLGVNGPTGGDLNNDTKRHQPTNSAHKWMGGDNTKTRTTAADNHTHKLDLKWDAETRPKNLSVNWIIRAKAVL